MDRRGIRDLGLGIRGEGRLSTTDWGRCSEFGVSEFGVLGAGLSGVGSNWIKVIDLNEGDYIAVFDDELNQQENLYINYLFTYINWGFNYEIKQ